MSSYDKEAYADYLMREYEEHCKIYDKSLFEEIINLDQFIKDYSEAKIRNENKQIT